MPRSVPVGCRCLPHSVSGRGMGGVSWQAMFLFYLIYNRNGAPKRRSNISCTVSAVCSLPSTEKLKDTFIGPSVASTWFKTVLTPSRFISEKNPSISSSMGEAGAFLPSGAKSKNRLFRRSNSRHERSVFRVLESSAAVPKSDTRIIWRHSKPATSFVNTFRPIISRMFSGVKIGDVSCTILALF